MFNESFPQRNPFETKDVLPHGAYVVISKIASGSPAEQAGMRDGDIVVSVNGHAVRSSWQVPHLVSHSETPDVSVDVLRNGQKCRLLANAVGDQGTWRIGILLEQRHNYPVREIREEDGHVRYLQTVGLEDDIGQLLAQAVVKYKDHPEQQGKHQILSIVLQYETPKGQEKLDILARFNPKDIPVFYDAGLDAGGTYRKRTSRQGESIHLKSFLSEDGLQVLLHELGHAKQADDTYYGPLFDLYTDADTLIEALQEENEEGQPIGWKMFLFPGNIKFFLEYISNALEAAPRLKKVFGGLFEEAYRVSEEIDALAHRNLKLHEAAIGLATQGLKADGGTQDLPQPSLERMADLYRRVSEILPKFTYIVQYPIRACERDAEKSALMDLRAIRKETGLDFLRPRTTTCQTADFAEGIQRGINNTVELKLTDSRTEKKRYAFLGDGKPYSPVIIKNLPDGRTSIIPRSMLRVGSYMHSLGATPKNMRLKVPGETGPGQIPRPGETFDEDRKQAA